MQVVVYSSQWGFLVDFHYPCIWTWNLRNAFPFRSVQAAKRIVKKWNIPLRVIKIEINPEEGRPHV